MPSPGTQDIIDNIATYSFIPEGGGPAIYFQSEAQMIAKLASAVDAGWTSSYPVTPTTMEVAFISEFAGFFTLPGGAIGQQFIMALAQGIDQDIALWVASYLAPPGPGTHSYPVTAITIKAKITAITTAIPIVSNGSTALINAISDIFANNFGQETG